MTETAAVGMIETAAAGITEMAAAMAIMAVADNRDGMSKGTLAHK
jgi:hypothetical protein